MVRKEPGSQKVKRNCLKCNKEFFCNETGKESKFCCTYSCSNSYNAKPLSSEHKEKIQRSIKKYLIDTGKGIRQKNQNEKVVKTKSGPRLCKICNNSFIPISKEDAVYCSKKCQFSCQEYRGKMSDIQKELYRKGITKGWKSRSGKSPSYPEKFFMKTLNSNGVHFEREFKVGTFFIDFAIHDKKIALEIDGKQHMEPDRKERDERKDVYLRQNGWAVVRIPWKSLNNQSGKDYMREQITNFLDLYNNTITS
jgi:very-short-patch-repair endonuclease